MADIPIIFSAPMVRALIDGRKTMTRRLLPASRQRSLWHRVKVGDRLWVRESYRYHGWDEDGYFWVKYLADNVVSKHMDVGDSDTAQGLMERLCGELDLKSVPLDADGNYESLDALKSYPSIHMPRWASRLTIIVTATKIEPVHCISYEDARAEGMPNFGSIVPPGNVGPLENETMDDCARRLRWPQRWFAELWRTLHGDENWKADTEVVALTFTVHKSNIDALPKAEAA